MSLLAHRSAPARSSPPAASPSDLDASVLAERVRLLFSKSHVALGSNLLNSAIVAAALWGSLPANLLLGWLAAMYAVNLARLALWLRIGNRVGADPRRVRRLANLWTLGAGLSGATWGAAGLLFAPNPPLGRDLVLVVVAGMVAGSQVTMTSYFPAFVAFLLTSLSQVIVREVLVGGRIGGAVAILATIFGALMLVLGRNAEQVLVRSIKLRLNLAAAREALVESNRTLEARVASRTRELEQALAEHDRFVSVVSHELRSPLSALSLNETMLQRVLAQPEVDLPHLGRLSETLARQTDRVARLVDDLLDLSRLSTERMRYAFDPVDARDVIDDCLQQLAPELRACRASFEIHVESGLVGNWDRVRIGQVVSNLMSNALRHGRPPFSIVARQRSDHALVVVRDHGDGISPEHLQNLFAPYERAGAARSKPGLGLGLFIAKRIVAAHGGTIRAENLDRGAAFVVELPLVSAAQRPPAGAGEPPPPPAPA